MNAMNNLQKIICVAVVTSLLNADCSKKLDQLLVNPNNPSISTADVDLYLNQTQLSFRDFYNSANDRGMELTRQIVMFGPLYTNNYQPETFDGLWTTAYASFMKNVNAMLDIA